MHAQCRESDLKHLEMPNLIGGAESRAGDKATVAASKMRARDSLAVGRINAALSPYTTQNQFQVSDANNLKMPEDRQHPNSIL